MENNENKVKLAGKLVSLRRVWSDSEHVTYEGVLCVYRDSGTVDKLPIIVNNVKEELLMTFVSVTGQFRSRDLYIDGKLKVQLYVFVTSIEPLLCESYENTTQITGYICKQPTLRSTPSGKQISDVLLACNYSKNKTAYIPVIVWGKQARVVGKYSTGTLVSIQGRIQSRPYQKKVDNGFEEREAYELSASSVELTSICN